MSKGVKTLESLIRKYIYRAICETCNDFIKINLYKLFREKGINNNHEKKIKEVYSISYEDALVNKLFVYIFQEVNDIQRYKLYRGESISVEEINECIKKKKVDICLKDNGNIVSLLEVKIFVNEGLGYSKEDLIFLNSVSNQVKEKLFLAVFVRLSEEDKTKEVVNVVNNKIRKLEEDKILELKKNDKEDKDNKKECYRRLKFSNKCKCEPINTKDSKNYFSRSISDYIQQFPHHLEEFKKELQKSQYIFIPIICKCHKQ